MKRSLLAAASTKTKIVKFAREFVVFDEQALRAFVLSQGFVEEVISYRLMPGAKVPEPVEDHIVMIGDWSDHPTEPDEREAKRRGYYLVGDSASVIEELASKQAQVQSTDDEISERIDTSLALLTASAARKGNPYGWLDTLEHLAGQKAKHH